MIHHNYVPEATEYPMVVVPKDRFKQSLDDKVKLYALKRAYNIAMKKELGTNWKTKLNQNVFHRQFNKSIQSNTKILAEWN